MNTIRKARTDRNYTQEDLAAKLGVERSAIAKWETGRSHPRAEMLLRLSSVLGCTVDELLRSDSDSLNEQKGA